jgi:hypothetical protein
MATSLLICATFLIKGLCDNRKFEEQKDTNHGPKAIIPMNYLTGRDIDTT